MLYWIYFEETTWMNYDQERLYYLKVICIGLLVLIYFGSVGSLYFAVVLVKGELRLKREKRTRRNKIKNHGACESNKFDCTSEMSSESETPSPVKKNTVLPGLFVKPSRRNSIAFWNRENLEDDEMNEYEYMTDFKTKFY